MRLTARFAALCAVLSCASSAAVGQPSGPAPDYADPAAWVCRPGAETPCTTDLDAMAVQADGSRTLQVFHAADNAPVDCFYVYPTTSHEPTDYADMAATPEVVRTVHDQAGRLTSRCRLYAPIYRQMTSAGLERRMQAHDASGWERFDGPYVDVRAAWRWYMANANQGRGVVLVGHSQGAIVLQRLIADEIDGKPAQRRLVAAFLAGDPSLAVPTGARVGGVFKAIPLCSAPAAVGCVYVWGDYLADDATPGKRFGADPGGGLSAGCADPAAPAGGSGLLKPYLHKPATAPAGDPPWIEPLGQLSVACVDDGHNNVARVLILPSGRFADRLAMALDKRSDWGLHGLDMALTQGDIVDRIGDEIAVWPTRVRR